MKQTYQRLLLYKERIVLHELNTCDKADVKSIGFLNEFIANEAKTKFWNASLLEYLFCVFNTSLVLEQQNPRENLRLANNKNVIDNINQLVSLKSGQYGDAWKVNLNGIKDLIVIKTPIDSRHDDLFHEFFIGVECLNKLREVIPNYMYIYGYFNCELPEKKLGAKEAVHFCRLHAPQPAINTKQVKTPSGSYLITEYISGLRFGEWCRNPQNKNLERYLSYILQIVFSLQVAGSSCQYTHYDLHDANVLLRDIDNETYIKYNIGGNDIYIKTDKVATIIDYGLSKVTVDGESFTPNGNSDSWARYRPVVDLYRILGWSLLGISISDKDLTFFREVVKLLEWFEFYRNYLSKGNTSESFLLAEHRNGFILDFDANVEILDKNNQKVMVTQTFSKAKQEEAYKYPLLDFWNFVRKTFPEVVNNIITNKVPANVLNCDSMQCPSLDSILKESMNISNDIRNEVKGYSPTTQKKTRI